MEKLHRTHLQSPAGRESGNLAGYFQSKAFADKPLDLGAVIPFRVPGTQYVAHGYEATTLIEICERYLEARDEGLLKGAQKKLAIQAEVVIRSCAKVGTIALIDEATGYDKFKKKQEYQLKLQAFIADELQDWARMFPDAFWYELARLEGIHYSPRSRPLRWEKYVMMFVYDAVDGDVGRELRKKTPDPHFLQNHHQWLKKFGREKVHDQITTVESVNVSDNVAGRNRESDAGEDGGRLVKHARYYWLLLAEGHLTRRRFGAMLSRLALLPAPTG